MSIMHLKLQIGKHNVHIREEDNIMCTDQGETNIFITYMDESINTMNTRGT